MCVCGGGATRLHLRNIEVLVLINKVPKKEELQVLLSLCRLICASH